MNSQDQNQPRGQNENTFAEVAFVVEANGDRGGGELYVVGDYIRVKVSSRDTRGAFAVMEGRTEPMHGPPLHVHYEQDEWWYILEGQFLFEVDGQQIHAGPGETVFARKGTRHAFQNIGTTTGRSLVTVVPGGLDVFFLELSEMVPPGTELQPDKLVPLFRKHGLELLGPPLAARTTAAAGSTEAA